MVAAAPMRGQIRMNPTTMLPKVTAIHIHGETARVRVNGASDGAWFQYSPAAIVCGPSVAGS